MSDPRWTVDACEVVHPVVRRILGLVDAAVRDAAEVPALRERLAAAEAVIGDLIDNEPCSLDHHGYCQTHCWLQEGECPVSRGRAIARAREQPR